MWTLHLQLPELEPERYLQHQLHRLTAEQVRELARDLARERGLLKD